MLYTQYMSSARIEELPDDDVVAEIREKTNDGLTIDEDKEKKNGADKKVQNKNKQCIDNILKQSDYTTENQGKHKTWRFEFIARVNSDVASTPELNSGCRLMRSEKNGTLSTIIGDVRAVPHKRLVVVTNRVFASGEIITYVPLDYIRFGTCDAVFDVQHNTLADDDALAKFETSMRTNPALANILLTHLGISFASDFDQKRRTGSFLGAFVGENVIEDNWARDFGNIREKVYSLAKSAKTCHQALRLMLSTYVRCVAPMAHVVYSYVGSGDAQSQVLPMIAVVAAHDIEANRPVVAEAGIYSRIMEIDSVIVRDALLEIYRGPTFEELKNEVVKELIAEAQQQAK